MPTTPRTAQRLRDAAQTIRKATATVQPVSHEEWQRTEASAHAALWSPPVALAVADLLDSEAYRAEQLRSTPHTPARLADLILADQA